jgi:tRNA uridine 5-carbamoylmethylation protein Kti12
MKTLIILSAIPASGKSTWAAQYQATHKNVYIVSSDAIRMEVTNGDYQDHTRQKEVWELFSKRIHEYGAINDSTVILDALNDTNALRDKYVKENPEFDKYILVTFPFDPERCRHYNSLRPQHIAVPDNIMDILINKYEQPTEEIKNLFDEIWEIRWRDRV